MRKFGWIVGAASAAALIGAMAFQGVAASAAPADHGQSQSGPGSTVLRFNSMTPVTGPFTGSANPIRGVNGGGLPWILRSGRGTLRSDGQLFVRVRGLVLANDPSVPAALRDTNPFPDFRALVSCQTIGAGNTATVTNVSTGNFTADAKGDSKIVANVTLPEPCFAPIVFVTGPTGTDAWFAVTGG